MKNFGKRYRRGDTIGTPFAVTINDETIDKGIVTVRERDTMKQEYVSADDLIEYLSKCL